MKKLLLTTSALFVLMACEVGEPSAEKVQAQETKRLEAEAQNK